MTDYWRETFSYFGLYKEMSKVKKVFTPEYFNYSKPEEGKSGKKEKYFLYYEPETVVSDKIVIWIHGGGWNAGNPKYFDYVGQYMAGAGYRFISLGYRLSTQVKYPCQIEDVCEGFNAAIDFLRKKGIDVSKIVVSGPSAGAHLSSIMCYSKAVQEKYGVDISPVIGYVGFGGPYSFREDQTSTLRILSNNLFNKGDDKKTGEPVSLMSKNNIPMLLIQSKHDGIVGFECAEDFAKKAEELGNSCEIYSVEDKKDTHSWYTAGLFLETREENKTLDKFLSWVEQL